jgi:hypothetical protein
MPGQKVTNPALESSSRPNRSTKRGRGGNTAFGVAATHSDPTASQVVDRGGAS